MTLAHRLREYALLLRLDRPIGILLLLWPTLWGLWIAGEGAPSALNLLVFVLGTVLMRSAGCAVNDWADRDIDPHVKRTAARPLAARRIAGWEALMLAAGLSFAAFALTLAFTHWLVVALSVAAGFLAASYPFTKRFFVLPQAYLGVAFGFGIPMAFAAETGAVPAVAWCMLAANLCWTIAYDTEYAMVDRDDDARIGIRTSALLFGRLDVVMVMLCYAVSLTILAWAGQTLGMHGPYYAGLGVAGGIAVKHYFLIRSRSREGCFAAFQHNNWFGAAVFAGIVADYGWRG